eukprot:RCo007890
MERLEASIAEERRRHSDEVERLSKEVSDTKARAQTHSSATEEQRLEIERLERLLVETQRDSCQVENIRCSLKEKERLVGEQQQTIQRLQDALQGVYAADQVRAQTEVQGVMSWLLMEETKHRADVAEQEASFFVTMVDREREVRQWRSALRLSLSRCLPPAPPA